MVQKWPIFIDFFFLRGNPISSLVTVLRIIRGIFGVNLKR